MDSVFFVLEIIGTVAFALSGALTAMKREMDIFGACVLGMTTAIGGGIIRDLILGVTPPVAFTNPVNAIIGLVVPAFTYLPFLQKYFLQDEHKTYDRLFLVADSVGLAVFTMIGVNACFQAIENPNLFTVVFLGVITGVGGGILRDVFSHNIPKIFVKNIYASASILGAVLAALLRPVDPVLASFLGMGLIILLRFLAAHLRWDLPRPKLQIKE